MSISNENLPIQKQKQPTQDQLDWLIELCYVHNFFRLFVVLVYISDLIANYPNTDEHNKNNFNETKINSTIYSSKYFPCGSAGKETTCNVGDLGSIPGLGRSPGGGHGNPHQYSCLENPQGQRSLVGCRSIVSQSQTRLKGLSAHTCTRACKVTEQT